MLPAVTRVGLGLTLFGLRGPSDKCDKVLHVHLSLNCDLDEVGRVNGRLKSLNLLYVVVGAL